MAGMVDVDGNELVPGDRVQIAPDAENGAGCIGTVVGTVLDGTPIPVIVVVEKYLSCDRDSLIRLPREGKSAEAGGALR